MILLTANLQTIALHCQTMTVRTTATMLLFGNHQNVALLISDPCHPMGAGASMSPGIQILALTDTSASA